MKIPTQPQLSVLALLAVLPLTLCAQDWLHGAFFLGPSSGEVSLELPGGGHQALPEAGESSFIEGLFQLSAENDGQILLGASNSVSALFAGEGLLAIERFEQKRATTELDTLSTTPSRMILYLREGLLVVDNRSMGQDSQFILETPLGRIKAEMAYWYIHITYEQQRQFYNLTIECQEGTIHMSNQQGENYMMRVGQRLSAAGTTTSPSIKVSEATRESVEAFELFTGLSSEVAWDKITIDHYRDFMRPLSASSRADLKSVQMPRLSPSKHPIVIEYAPRPAATAPYRGKLEPSNKVEAELF